MSEKKYEVLSQIRANGKFYTIGSIFPDNLLKVDYNELLDLNLIKVLPTKITATTTTQTTPVVAKAKKDNINTKEND